MVKHIYIYIYIYILVQYTINQTIDGCVNTAMCCIYYVLLVVLVVVIRGLLAGPELPGRDVVGLLDLLQPPLCMCIHIYI